MTRAGNVEFTENGIIGKSGKFYPCKSGYHIETALRNIDDRHFVFVYESEFITTEIPANKKQFETAMDWCTSQGYIFDDCAIHQIWDEWSANHDTSG